MSSSSRYSKQRGHSRGSSSELGFNTDIILGLIRLLRHSIRTTSDSVDSSLAWPEGNKLRPLLNLAGDDFLTTQIFCKWGFFSVSLYELFNHSLPFYSCSRVGYDRSSFSEVIKRRLRDISYSATYTEIEFMGYPSSSWIFVFDSRFISLYEEKKRNIGELESGPIFFSKSSSQSLQRSVFIWNW